MNFSSFETSHLPFQHVPEKYAEEGLFIAAGALEYWLCDEMDLMHFFDSNDLLERSEFCPELTAEIGS